MTKGSTARPVVKQGVKISVGLLAVSLGVFAEALICAALGPVELAAFGLGVPVTVILFALALGVNTGIAVEVATSADTRASSIAAGLALQVCFAGLVWIGLVVCAGSFASLTAASEEIGNELQNYIALWGGVSLAASFSFAGVATLQGIGKAGLTGGVMVVKTLVGVICSAALGLGLLGIPPLGLVGVVLGGVVGQTVGAMHAAILLWIHLKVDWRIRVDDIVGKARSILKTGVPAGLSQALDPVALLFVATAAGFIGIDTLGAHTLLSRVERILMVPGVSMGIALVPALSERRALGDVLSFDEIANQVRSVIWKYALAVGVMGVLAVCAAYIWGHEGLRLDWTIATMLLVVLVGPFSAFIVLSAECYAVKRPSRVVMATGFYSLVVVPIAGMVGVLLGSLSAIYGVMLLGMMIALQWLAHQSAPSIQAAST